MLNEFIELVSVPCPSKDEKAEAELIMRKLDELGIEYKMDTMLTKNRRQLRQHLGLYKGYC